MTNIDAFQEKVIRIRPNNFMALGGAAAGIIGSADSGTDAVAQLQRAALAFARVYKDNESEQYIAAARKEVLAKTMVALTLDAITEKQADDLVSDLNQLMKERKN